MHTCCSIKPFKGLMITPIALQRGPMNMQRLLPDPVAIRMKTSCPCRTALVASNCPGRKLEKPKYLCSVSCSQELSPWQQYAWLSDIVDQLAPITTCTQENPKATAMIIIIMCTCVHTTMETSAVLRQYSVANTILSYFGCLLDTPVYIP